MEESTLPGAVVATIWAGAPAYYSSRAMVDILGKSDAVIAAEPPKGSLFPGLNKWDYDYSVGHLRPDVVVQIWDFNESISDDLGIWGY